MKFITSQMFDIRPRTSSGEVDISRITQGAKALDLRYGEPIQTSLPHSVNVAATVEEKASMYGRVSVPVRRHGRLKPRKGLDIRVEQAPPAELPEMPSASLREPDFPTIDTVITQRVQSRAIPAHEPRELPPPATLPISELEVDLVPEPLAIEEPEPESFLIPEHGPEPLVAYVEPILHKRVSRKWSFAYPLSFVFTVLAAILLVPSLAFLGSARALESSLLSAVTGASEQLESATLAMASLDTESASWQFAEAQETFRDASDQLSSIGFGLLSLLAEVPLSAKLTSGKAILEAGEHLAAAGEEMSYAVSVLEKLRPEEFLADTFAIGNQESARVVQEKGASFEDALIKTAAHLSAATDALERVDINAVPDEYRERMTRVKAGIPTIRAGVTAIQDSARALAGMLGMNNVRRYLVLLQNSSELRPTGGFVGNVALLTIANGRLVELKVEDTYLFDGQIIKYTVPPKPIQDISSAWSLHDSNWYRDFPTSARIASDFFEVSGGATVDGVFSVSSPILERILEIVGPVVTEEGIVLDSTSVVDVLNLLGATQRPGETTQIRAMADLMPLILEKATSAEGEAKEQMRDALAKAISAGDIQMWFRDEEEENIAQKLGVSGAIPETEGDFLAVVHANINGFKSERVISEQVLHEATIARDGTVMVEVTITRRHHGDGAMQDFYREVSKSYTRLLVPEGSQLLEVNGVTCRPDDVPPHALEYAELSYLSHPIVTANEATLRPFSGEPCVEIGTETGKAVFATWIFTSPGETSVTKFRYRLPGRMIKETESYGLIMLKQSGFVATFESRIKAEAPWGIAWSDDGYQRLGNKELVSRPKPLERSQFLGAVLTRE